MKIFTLEIGGRPIAAVRAEDREQALDLVEDDSFQEDMQDLDTDTGPLWNGDDVISLRDATAEELESLQKSWEQGVADGEIDDDDDNLHVVFLVPVYEGDEDEDEDDDDEDEDEKPQA